MGLSLSIIILSDTKQNNLKFYFTYIPTLYIRDLDKLNLS